MTALGAFIVVEGPDAVGKETQTKLLVARFQRMGIEAKRFSFHRYETELGKAIKAHLTRSIIVADNAPEIVTHARATNSPGLQVRVTPTPSAYNDLIFQCMALADKCDAAADIKAYVQAGGIAVCDRWWQSMYAYGGVDGLNLDWALRASSVLPQADANLLIELPLVEARRRRPVPEDRYEEDEVKQEAVRKLYAGLWAERAAKSQTWLVIDGFSTEGAVQELIWRKVENLLRQTAIRQHLQGEAAPVAKDADDEDEMSEADYRARVIELLAGFGEAVNGMASDIACIREDIGRVQMAGIGVKGR